MAPMRVWKPRTLKFVSIVPQHSTMKPWKTRAPLHPVQIKTAFHKHQHCLVWRWEQHVMGYSAALVAIEGNTNLSFHQKVLKEIVISQSNPSRIKIIEFNVLVRPRQSLDLSLNKMFLVGPDKKCSCSQTHQWGWTVQFCNEGWVTIQPQPCQGMLLLLKVTSLSWGGSASLQQVLDGFFLPYYIKGIIHNFHINLLFLRLIVISKQETA